MENQYGKCLRLFSIPKYSGHLGQFFNVISPGTFMSFAMQNPRRHSSFWFCIKTEVSKEKIWAIFIPMNGFSLGAKVSIIIDILCKTWKHNLGTEYTR